MNATALSTLHEACELPECLEALIKLNPDLDIQKEKDMLLAIRFLSTKTGLAQMIKDNKVLPLLKRWDEDFCYRYVKLTEGCIADALTLRRYDIRSGTVKTISQKNVFLPPHLYGQLNQQKDGLQILLEHGNCKTIIKTVIEGECGTTRQILNLKAAIWSVGHLSTSNAGLVELNSKGVIDAVLDLAQSAQVYSIRAIAFYSLGLVATTKMGADLLFKKGMVVLINGVFGGNAKVF